MIPSGLSRMLKECCVISIVQAMPTRKQGDFTGFSFSGIPAGLLFEEYSSPRRKEFVNAVEEAASRYGGWCILGRAGLASSGDRFGKCVRPATLPVGKISQKSNNFRIYIGFHFTPLSRRLLPDE